MDTYTFGVSVMYDQLLGEWINHTALGGIAVGAMVAAFVVPRFRSRLKVRVLRLRLPHQNLVRGCRDVALLVLSDNREQDAGLLPSQEQREVVLVGNSESCHSSPLRRQGPSVFRAEGA